LICRAPPDKAGDVDADDIKRLLGLEPLPVEGGWFLERLTRA